MVRFSLTHILVVLSLCVGITFSTAIPAHAGPFDALNPKNLIMGQVKKAMRKKLAEIMGVNAPLKLDQANAYAPVSAPANFRPRALRNMSADDLKKPLAPGDYKLPVVGYCTAAGVPSPQQGMGAKFAPLQGQSADAVSALLMRGTAANVPVTTLQAMVWRVEDGLPVSQWPESDRGIVHQLVPEYEKKLEGDQLQQIEGTYNKYANIAGLPPLETFLEKEFGDVGHAVAQLLTLRKQLVNQSISNERLVSLLFEQANQAAPVVSEDGQPSPWSEIQPGIVGRFTMMGGADHENLFEFRVLPTAIKDIPRRAAMAGPRLQMVQATGTAVEAPIQLFPTIGSILEGAPMVAGQLLTDTGEVIVAVLDAPIVEAYNAGYALGYGYSYIVYSISDAAKQPLIAAPSKSEGDSFENRNAPRPGIDKPPFPVPGDPDADWRWIPNPKPGGRLGKWVPDRPVPVEGGKGGRPAASWDDQVGSNGKPHWDVDLGNGDRERYDGDGNPISDDEAHGKKK